jgi:hypothetical protein
MALRLGTLIHLGIELVSICRLIFLTGRFRWLGVGCLRFLLRQSCGTSTLYNFRKDPLGHCMGRLDTTPNVKIPRRWYFWHRS